MKEVRLAWVPGHTNNRDNELAGSLANFAITAPVQFGLRNLALFAYSRDWLLDDTRSDAILTNEEDLYLKFGWNFRLCDSRKCEVTFMELRCRTPMLNLYLCRTGLSPTELCVRCRRQANTVLLTCHRFSAARQLL